MQVDVSTYPKAAPISQPTMLDTVGKLQGVEQQSLSISKAQLDQVNQGYSYLMRELNSLPPNATADDMRQYATNAVKMRLISPDMAAQFISTIPNDPAKIKAFRDTIAGKFATNQEGINFQYGRQTYPSNQQQTQPSLESPRFGLIPNAPHIQHQLPPTTPDVRNGQPTFVGPRNIPVFGPPSGGQAAPPVGKNRLQATPPGAPAGAPVPPVDVVAPPQAPNSRLPVTPPAQLSQGSGASIDERFPPAGPQGSGASIDERFPPAGPNAVTGMPPLWEEGRKLFNEDQQLATTRLAGIRPAMIALKMMPGLASGPTTEAWTTAVAALKANNIIPTNTANDPTAIRQEINKYLASYVSSRTANRSDADLAQTEARSPNAGIQILPALLNLTRKQIALDRLEASRPGAFNNQDFAQYGQHRVNHSRDMDERAFEFSMLSREQQQRQYGKMREKAMNGDRAAIRFLRSLTEANRQNLLTD